MRIIWEGLATAVVINLVLIVNVIIFAGGKPEGYYLTTEAATGGYEYCVVERRSMRVNTASFCSTDPSAAITVYQHLTGSFQPQLDKKQ